MRMDPPEAVTAVGGVGQVTIDWSSVETAVGYLVHRDGQPLDHHGGDVLAVPGPPYVDTTGEIGRTYRYAVAGLPEASTVGQLSPAVEAASLSTGPSTDRRNGTDRRQGRGGGTVPVVGIEVDVVAEGAELHRPWEAMVGSERLSQVLCTDLVGGRPIGAELTKALGRMRYDLGVRSVRAHAIFHDDTRIYDELPDFTVVDEIYDRVLAIGLRPVVEIGFMPRDLASDPSRTVFEYGAIISPPKDYDRWGELVRRFVSHLVSRYGIDEIRRWDFEVWNEANLDVFWSGTKAEWLRLYDVTAAAVKSVDPSLPVGGPSSAAAGWVDDFLAHAAAHGTPVDFVSTHTYGSPPLDLRASLVRHGFEDARILWTEWGVTPTHFNPVNDSVFSGVFLIDGMRSVTGRVDALSYWVASDHFEELGRPPRLLHGGFGLLTVGGIPKPRFHALTLLSRSGPVELPVRYSGDGGGSLVKAWASRDRDRIAVLVWNLTLDQSKSTGDPALTRTVRISGVDSTWQATATHLAIGSGDLVSAATDLGLTGWPDSEAEWQALAEHSALTTVPSSGMVELTMPSAVLVEFRPPTR